MLRYALPLFLILSTAAQARPWPGTFSRQLYHTFYVKSEVVDSMPFSLPNFKFEVGKPALLNIITAYAQLGTHPQNSIDPPRYIPPFSCRFKGNVPVYDRWTFIIGTSEENPITCN